MHIYMYMYICIYIYMTQQNICSEHTYIHIYIVIYKVNIFTWLYMPCLFMPY